MPARELRRDEPAAGAGAWAEGSSAGAAAPGRARFERPL